MEPDTVAPFPRKSLYCSVWDWIRPAELEAQEPSRQTTATVDSSATSVRSGLVRPARQVHVSGLRPRAHMNEARVHSDRAHSMKVRATVNLVELH